MLPVKIKICQCGREVTVCRFFSYDLCFDLPYAAALIVFIANGILTVGRKIPLSCYVRLLMIPIVFLIVGTGAVFLNLSKVPMDAFAVPVGEIYITASRESAFGQSIYVSRRWRQ